jgi:hypothetical protein
MEPEVSLPCFQENNTGPYPEPDESSPHPPTYSFKILLSSFLGSTTQLRPWPPPQNLAEFLGGFSTIFFFTG